MYWGVILGFLTLTLTKTIEWSLIGRCITPLSSTELCFCFPIRRQEAHIWDIGNFISTFNSSKMWKSKAWNKKVCMIGVRKCWCHYLTFGVIVCTLACSRQASDSGVGREIREREKTIIKTERGSHGRYIRGYLRSSPLLTSSERLEQTMYRQIS